jgi:hypothetical protein
VTLQGIRAATQTLICNISPSTGVSLVSWGVQATRAGLRCGERDDAKRLGVPCPAGKEKRLACKYRLLLDIMQQG